MDTLMLIFVVAGFLAVVLMFEGGYLLWYSSRSAEARRLKDRLKMLSAGGRLSVESELIRERLLSNSPRIERLLRQMPRAQLADRLLHQSGLSGNLASLLRWTLVAGFCGTIAFMVLPVPKWAWLPMVLCSTPIPFLYMLHCRRRRLRRLESQLPDALELMARAMRAGHALPSALHMVGTEGAEPIASEFRAVSDEVNYGVALQDALTNLVLRVPITDLRFFVISVIVQRETGGNLAELLDKLSRLIRERFKLMGTIRVLSSEGRLSGWILTVLPFALVGLINMVNPKFMSILWKDPAGMFAIYAGLSLVVAGIFWMWRIVKIRV
jgi:tight adherence protein B